MPVISSLGVGSGVLTADTIDKLKENDKSLTVKPIENKISLAKQEGSALDLLDSLLTTFQASVSALDYDVMYQKRSVSGNNDGINVVAQSGVDIQSFSISDTKLATTNVLQSSVFTSDTASIASGIGTMNINVNGKNYNIDYNSSTTLSTLKSSINEATGGAVKATILKTNDSEYRFILTSKDTGHEQAISITDFSGKLDSQLVANHYQSDTFSAATDAVAGANTGKMQIDIDGQSFTFDYDASTSLTGLANTINQDTASNAYFSASVVKNNATNEYQLVLTPTKLAVNQSITVTDLGETDANGVVIDPANQTLSSKLLTSGTATNVTGGEMEEIQTATDATFKYNGIEMTRSSNSIDDITVGLTINLLDNGQSANINITQDREPIVSELENFVSSYNTLESQLNDLTLASIETGKVGIFNSNNTIKNIGREISRLITSVNGDNQSLANYGITLKQDGTMSFDRKEFDAKMDEDPKMVEAFFSTATIIDEFGKAKEVNGIFTQLNTKMDSLLDSSGLIQLLSNANKDAVKSLETEHDRALSLLNARYDTMTARFVAYDTIINRINSQSSALTQQIDMAIAAQKG